MTAVLRAKMRVQSVTREIDSDGGIEAEWVKLIAVYGDKGTENAKWAQWTPSANFEIQINNPEAIGKLSRGHEYFVDFTPIFKDANLPPNQDK